MVSLHAPTTIPELRLHIATELRRGKSQADLVRYLGTRGWPEVTARPFVANAARFNALQNQLPASPQPSSTAPPADAYKQRLVRGLLWVLAGIGLSFVVSDIIMRGA